MKNLLLFAYLCIASTTIAKAGTQLEKHDLAYQTVASWQKLWDTNKGVASSQYISKGMLAAVPMPEIMQSLTDRRARLGAMEQRQLIKSVPHGKMYSFPKAEYVAFHFKADYENQKNVSEVVRVIKEKGQWLIFSDLIQD